MKRYCVWDAIYGDFLENFETSEAAKEYCRNQIKKGVKGIYIVGRWTSNNLESTEYKELCRIAG